MSINPLQDTFVRGEISPRLHARASLDLYRAGLSLCENFITLPHGGIRKRGGTYFVDEVPDAAFKTRLIRFVFSDDQAYVLVLSHLVIRVYAYGARVPGVQISTPWTQDEIFGVKHAQSADDMWLVHPNHEPRKLSRLAHTSWMLSIVGFDDGPFQPVNTDESITVYSSAATGLVTITASAPIFNANMAGRLLRVDMASYTDIPPWESYGIIDQPTLGTRRRYEGRVYETPTAYNNIGTHEVRTGATPPTHTSGTEWDGQSSTEFRPDTPNLQLDIYHGLRWTYLHSGYGVARIVNVAVGGYSVTASVLTTFPDETVGSGNASYLWRLGAFDEGSYPDSVAIFEERLSFAQRFSVVASKTGDFESFKTGEKADDALSFRLAGGGQANDIVWIEDADGFLAIGTIGGIRSLSGSGIDEALTPSSFKNRRSRTMPCANIAPVNAGRASMYVAKGRKAIVELTLNSQFKFQTEDVGQISEHIPKRGVVELAFQEYPDPFLWFPVDTGELGGLTYQPAQEVRGMHRHLMGGSFNGGNAVVESACVTPGQNGQDDVWLVVKRTVDGGTRRYIEIITPALEYGDIVDSFHVDCGLSRTGSPAASVAGLVHIKGEIVDVLADSIVYRGLTVSGVGSLTLPGGATASTWHVGLPYTASADTLELDVGGKDGSLLGRKKRVTEVILSLFETDLSGLEITSMQRTRWEPVKVPTIAAQGAASKLFTGNIRVPIDDSWEGQGRIRLRHTKPTPCTVRAMTPVFDSEP